MLEALAKTVASVPPAKRRRWDPPTRGSLRAKRSALYFSTASKNAYMRE
jgi:hypothetical protein